MKVLIIGSGGREHALAWKFSQSKDVHEIYVAPGNCGMQDVCQCVDIKATEIKKLVDFAKSKAIDLTVVGLEQALESGIVDAFKEANLRIIGPTKEAALIETSKYYAKELMKKYNIPTASYQTFTDYEEALHYVKTKGYPIVIKVDNLAAGKGVTIVNNEEEAVKTLDETLRKHKFDCKKVVIEEFLEGIEFSLMAFVKGDKVYPLELAKDHKRAFDHDLGPNTGGMGAFSPVGQIPKHIIDEAMEKIMIPCAKALVEEKRPFEGILYGGLILTKTGPKVIEFNARFGDPEIEVLLPRLKNDLFVLINDLLDGKPITLNWDDKSTIGVVLASKGYPVKYEKGVPIKNLKQLKDVTIFHMGTTIEENIIKTNGGRVLIVVSKEESIDKAREKVYEEIKKIDCENLFYRNDIGKNNK